VQRSLKTIFEKGLGTYIREDVETLLEELQVFCDHVQRKALLTTKYVFY